MISIALISTMSILIIVGYLPPKDRKLHTDDGATNKLADANSTTNTETDTEDGPRDTGKVAESAFETEAAEMRGTYAAMERE